MKITSFHEGADVQFRVTKSSLNYKYTKKKEQKKKNNNNKGKHTFKNT